MQRTPAASWTTYTTAMLLVLFGAAYLLYHNLSQGFPYLIHPDEGQLYTMSQRILTIGSRTSRTDYSPGFVWVLGADFIRKGYSENGGHVTSTCPPDQ